MGKVGKVSFGAGAQAAGMFAWLFLSFAVALFGSQFEPGEWYRGLDRAPWTPPDWVFGVAWTILYILMAVAAWVVWRRGGFGRNFAPLMAYGVQMLFNALWSWIFFGLQEPGWALVNLVLLWIALTITVLLFQKKSALSGLLLVPYYIWIIYALSLNAWIWWWN